jgi:vacuolar-type H+-ATPase subunit I/STV1
VNGARENNKAEHSSMCVKNYVKKLIYYFEFLQKLPKADPSMQQYQYLTDEIKKKAGTIKSLEDQLEKANKSLETNVEKIKKHDTIIDDLHKARNSRYGQEKTKEESLNATL